MKNDEDDGKITVKSVIIIFIVFVIIREWLEVGTIFGEDFFKNVIVDFGIFFFLVAVLSRWLK